MNTIFTLCIDNSRSSIGEATQAAASGKVVVDWVTDKRNTTLTTAHGAKRRRRTACGWAVDALALGAVAYVTDECVARSDSRDSWCRDIAIEMPLPASSGLSRALDHGARALSFCSGDHVAFSMLPSARPLRIQIDPLVSQGADAVCLFSGGADSLLGAAHLLEQGLRVCLVGHYADGITAATQESLVQRLTDHFRGQIEYRPIYLARSALRSPAMFALLPKTERSHRVRSFLFLTAAAVFAEAYGRDTIYMPENGVIALNLPLDSTRAGSHSTRTAHPHFLSEMSGVFTKASGRDIRICNPFALLSKTDLVAAAPPWTHELLLDSLSCAKYGRIGVTGIRHCGYCLPCIYRRIAFDAVGLDSPSHYATDVFESLPTLSHAKGHDLRSLATWFKSFGCMSDNAKRGAMCSNGPLRVSELQYIMENSQPLSMAQIVETYSRFVADAMARLQRKCSTQVRRVLDI